MNPPTSTVVEDRPAGLGARSLAVAVDLVVLLVCGGAVVPLAVVRTVRTGEGATLPWWAAAGAVLAAVVAVVQWLLHGRHGWTLGRLLLGVRTVDVHSRRPIGPWRVLLRGLVVALGALAVVGHVVVLLSPAFDRTGRGRGWHDRAVDAEVLRSARRADPGRRATGRGREAAAAPVAFAGPAAARPVAPPAGRTDTPDEVPRATGGVASVPRGGGSAVASGVGAPATGELVLAPLSPQRAAPDLDTRAVPVVRAAAVSYGLAPELELTRPAPPRADVVPSQRAQPATVLRVTFDDGRALTVERLALVGRNPTPSPGVQTVRVVDPGRSVSKTHLQLGVDAAGAWVVDRGSTNGTVVTLPDGAQVVCPVDHPVRLRPGAVVAFGDRSLRVLSVPVRPAD